MSGFYIIAGELKKIGNELFRIKEEIQGIRENLELLRSDQSISDGVKEAVEAAVYGSSEGK